MCSNRPVLAGLKSLGPRLGWAGWAGSLCVLVATELLYN